MSDDITGGDLASAMTGSDASASGSASTAGAPGTTGTATAEPTGAPATDGTTTATSKPYHVPPEQQWPTILENARAKAISEHEQQHWAKDYKADEVQQLMAFRKALQADPVATLEQEFASLVNHPVFGPQLRSSLGRQLAAGRGLAQQPPAEQTPALPTLQLEDGRQIDLQALKEQIQRDTLAAAQQQFQPAMAAAKELQDAKEFAVAQQHAGQFATGFYKELSQQPHFKTLEPRIKAELATIKLETDHPAEVRAAAYQIYTRLLASDVLPTLQTTERQSVLHDLSTKAHVSGVTPGQQSAMAPESYKDMSWEDALKREAARVGI